MWSLITTIGLLCLLSCGTFAAEEPPMNILKKSNVYFGNLEIVLDEQPISKNSFVHAFCSPDTFREDMNCTVVLRFFPDAKRIEEMTCASRLKAIKSRQIGTQFQLKKLFDNFVAFVWTDEEKLQSDAAKKHLVLSVIDMKNCQSHNYDFETSMEDFQIVVYKQTFDVYYHDKRRCGHFMCGESFNWNGKVLNGPATSYLPSEYFAGNTKMCSVRSNSSSMGHYVITSNEFHLVAADYGKRMLMGPLPIDAQVAVYACNEDFLGYCWLTNQKHIINCEQFNPRGGRILSTGASLDYLVGTWMAMKNLGPSELLLLISRCDDIESCARNTKEVNFYVMRMNPNGKTDELHRFHGLECDHAKNIKSEVIRNEDGQICATLACHAKKDDGQQSINLLSTCFRK